MAFSTEQSAEGSVAGGYDYSLSGKMQTNVWLPKGEALVGTSDREKGESQSYFENYAEGILIHYTSKLLTNMIIC